MIDRIGGIGSSEAESETDLLAEKVDNGLGDG